MRKLNNARIISSFRKSSYSTQGGNCVEVAATTDGGRAVRDSKDPHGTIHLFTPSEWSIFLSHLRAGKFGG
ncbi:DUF397 domain-containing protein [Allostreptomyces psammosilenae]|uniref:DUF397 domain-containing protein n=1 Tax=Allostreptomyces psammosilenae TaxID=1892865 RepID=A0A852ZPS3_9ACTN|nr:DUF397 domain-containing protein [Allostreptomyces psammosilenae]NYI04369.1 hypothetical protein [Allostreptomyces psammosilenae]